jgi:DNA-nicking Smr family endonuclease
LAKIKVFFFKDIKSNQWLNEKLEESKNIHSKLDLARQNAANDIFERVNSSGKMGVILDDENVESGVFVDLHGLHVNEAKLKLNELVLPMLTDLKKNNAHNRSRSSQ